MKFGGDAPYGIMFGPDICGTSTRKTHVIFGYDKTHADGERENLLTKKNIRCESDTLTHLYTLIVNSDNTYEVQIDQKQVESGKLADDWDFLAPAEIQDPKESKPSTWVDEKKIPDPAEKKPEGHDDIPKQIPDSEAEKPDDWDNEDDGEWEPPMVDNPEYKGEWTPTMVENPDYKDDKDLYKVCDPCDTVGFELWQVKAGSIFDDIVVTDSADEAKASGNKVMEKAKKEKEMHDAEEKKKQDEAEAERKVADAKKAEDDAKQAAEDDKEDDDDDDVDDDDEEDGAEAPTPPKDEL